MCYPYYRFRGRIDNKTFLIIASDNKAMIFFSYYRFGGRIDNKTLVNRFGGRIDNKDVVVEVSDIKTMGDGRAGMYAQQAGGYRAFVPLPLPPEPPIQFDAEMIQLLGMAERALGRLDGASGILLQQMDKYQRNRRFGYFSYLALFVDEQLVPR